MEWFDDESTFLSGIDGFPDGMKGTANDGKFVDGEISLLEIEGFDGQQQ